MLVRIADHKIILADIRLAYCIVALCRDLSRRVKWDIHPKIVTYRTNAEAGKWVLSPQDDYQNIINVRRPGFPSGALDCWTKGNRNIMQPDSELVASFQMSLDMIEILTTNGRVK